MKRSTKIDKLIEECYYRHGSGVEINVMDIGQIFKAGRAALESGADLESAIIEAIAKYRQN